MPDRGVAGLIADLAGRAIASGPAWAWTLTMPQATADHLGITDPHTSIGGLPTTVMPILETDMIAAVPITGSGPGPTPRPLYLALSSGQISREPPCL